MPLVDHTFRRADFVAGHLALDLANTVAGRDLAAAAPDAAARDRLVDFAAVVAWAAAHADAREAAGADAADAADGAHGFTRAEVRALAALGRRSPTRAADALAALRGLREAVFAVAAAAARSTPAAPAALHVLRDAWADAAAAARLAPGGGAFALRWTVADSGLALPRHRAAWAAVGLVTSAELARVRLCAGDDCGWLFLDRSKAGRRRWCDMASCGNVAKARRHYARRRAGA